MFTTKIMFILLLLCGLVLCDDGLSSMERRIKEMIRKSATSGTRRPRYKGCDPGSKEGSNGEMGACVKDSLCRTKEEIGTDAAATADPATFIVPRSLDSGTPPFDVDQIDIDNPGCGFQKVCCSLSDVLAEPMQKPAVEPIGCGFSNAGANTFRASLDLAGYAEYAEFPWMVALMNNEGGAASQYIGGGTIIHPAVVMTVAHKVDNYKANQLTCRAGEHNLTAKNEVYEFQERSVNKILIHLEYIRLVVQYDVALLVLSSPFDLTDAPHIGVACLEPLMPRPGTTCYSMGWGRDYDGKPQSNVLKKLTLPLVDQSRCEEQYHKKVSSNYSLHNTLMCAGGEENVDTCIGDGGSSLVCPIGDGDETRYSVVGMVGYGITDGCGNKNEPGFYVKVPAIYDWIVNQMSQLSLNSSTFVY